MIKKKELTQVIKEVSKEWLYDEQDFVCYWDINSGSCGEFALSVKERFSEDNGLTVVSAGQYLEKKGLTHLEKMVNFPIMCGCFLMENILISSVLKE